MKGTAMRGGWVLASLLLVACQSENKSEKAVAELVNQAATAQADALKAKAELEKLKAEAEIKKVKAEASAAAGGAVNEQAEVPATAGAGGAGAVPVGAPGEYDLSVINAMAADCKSPSVMLAGVPHAMAEKEDFKWAFALQALFAHPEFKIVKRAALKGPKEVAFEQGQVNTTATGLLAYCNDGDTCNRLAAMYKTTVPSSRPEVYCGKKWDPGSVPEGFASSASLNALAKKQLEKEASSMCARIGVCKKRLNPALEGDPGVACQKKPTEAKFKCGQKDSCEAVLECTGG